MFTVPISDETATTVTNLLKEKGNNNCNNIKNLHSETFHEIERAVHHKK